MAQVLATTAAGDANARASLDALLPLHGQLTGWLRSRLGFNHAELLAAPRVASDGSVRWSTTLPGEAKPLAALAASDAERLLQRTERLQQDLAKLADELQSEGVGDGAALAALRHVASLDARPVLHGVAGKPVLVEWARLAAAAPAAPAPLAPVLAVPAARAQAAQPVVAPGVPPTAAGVGDGRGAGAGVGAATGLGAAAATAARPAWLRWLLLGMLGLLLLAALLWGLRQCSAGGDGLQRELAEAEAKNRELEEAIAKKRNAPPSLMCARDEPAPVPPAASAPEPSPPPVVPVEPPPEAPKELPKPPPKELPKEPPKPAPKESPKEAPKEPPKELPKEPPKPEPPRAEAPRAEPAPPVQRQACKRTPGDEPEVLLIVDASGSMRHPFPGAASRLDAAKRASEAVIRGLPADVDIGLVDFAECGRVRRDRFYKAPERGALVGEINGLAPKRGTPLAEAIRRAGAVASSSADSAIIVVSDGGDSCGGDPCAAARAVRAARPNVTINVIDLSDSAADRAALQCVASAGGGRLLRPGDTVDMVRRMKEAAGAANCS